MRLKIEVRADIGQSIHDAAEYAIDLANLLKDKAYTGITIKHNGYDIPVYADDTVSTIVYRYRYAAPVNKPN